MRHEKLSPSILAALDEYDVRGRTALRPHVALMGLVSVDTGPKPTRMVVFVEADETASLAHLADAGLELNQATGRTRTGIVALDGLDRVSEDPAVMRVVASRRLDSLLDVATPRMGIPDLRTSGSLNGKNVVVGIVDTGIEPAHPSFTGRLTRIWDQTLPGKGVPEGAYGAELSGAHMEVSRDTVGHGTHVAGIAAGADETYGGVAPAASLVIVKTDLLTAHIADGIRYVFRVAADLGRPAVVNLSLGGHGDAHDGTDPLSAAVNASSGPGRIVCCAAGNEGEEDIHAQVGVSEDRTSTISFVVVPPGSAGGAPVAALNGWYDGADRLDVAVVSPTGTQTPLQPVITDGSPVRTYRLGDGLVRVVTPGPDPANGDHNFLVHVQPGRPRPGVSGPWRLRLRGVAVRAGRVDVWSADKRAAQFTGRAVRDAVKVGAPGAATRAVTVAAYTTKVKWEDIFGNPHDAGMDLEDVAAFSSEGPRRDGAEKPDVTAPGAMIVSALSAHAPVRAEELVDDRHTVMAGTSMAAPMVTGLVALLLQRDPGLDPEEVTERLRAAGSIPGRPPSTFDPKWGYGLIDARKL